MSKTWTRIAPSILTILAVLLTAPLLNSLALIQCVSVANLQLTEPHTIRLVADLLAFAIFCILAFAALPQTPGNGRGSSFLHNLSSAKLYTRAAGKLLMGRAILSITALYQYKYLNTLDGSISPLRELRKRCATRLMSTLNMAKVYAHPEPS